MKKALTLIKEIDKLAEELVRNYSIEEVNEAFNKYAKQEDRGFNYITSNIYLPDCDE